MGTHCAPFVADLFCVQVIHFKMPTVPTSYHYPEEDFCVCVWGGGGGGLIALFLF